MGLAMSADHAKACLAGVGTTKEWGLVCLVDKRPGKRDVFRLGTDGAPYTGDGVVSSGNIQTRGGT